MTGGISLPVSFFAKGLFAAANEIKNVMVCFSEVDATTSPALLTRLAEVFLSRHLPLACAVDFAPDAAGQHPAALAVRDIAHGEPGLFEVLATYYNGESKARYFQLREAAELRRQIVQTLGQGINDPDGFPLISIFDQRRGAFFDFSAFRSAGFRTHVSLNEEPGGTELAIVGREQLEVAGGMRIALATGAPWNLGELDERLSGAGDQLVTISLAGTAERSDDEMVSRCTDIATTLETEAGKGRIFVTRPIDLLLHSSERPAPSISLLLHAANDDDPENPVNIFASELQANNIPFTFLTDSADPDAPFCTLGPEGENCAMVTGNMPIADALPAATLLLAPDTENAWMGMRADGRLYIPTRGQPDMTAGELLPDNPITDEAIVLFPAAIETYLQRAILLNRLASMQREGVVRLHAIDGFTEHVLTADDIYGRFSTARKRMYTDPPQPADLTFEARATLLDDARLAWRFIERFTQPQTGMCSGTVRDGSPRVVNQDITMWDLASQIKGIIAARDLGIVDTEEAQGRINKILDNLPGGLVDGLRLPPLFFSARTKQTSIAGYDSCDTGRFFAALSASVAADLVTSERAQQVFESWDIADAVRDAHPFNHTEGKWVDSYHSHCTPYTSRSLAEWGVQVESPYPDMSDDNLTDARIRLLYQVGFIGHYGTEPMLLEAIELGPTPASTYLSGVLFDAQLTAYERSGQLKCASETLLDFEPWFSYQGIRVDRSEENGWVVAFPNQAAAFQTEEFKAKSEVISSKSAFLWAANYPHPHSDRLLDFIRQNARVDNLGFSAGVFAQTSEPMASYSDINTNGIILTAVAHMLSATPE